MPPIRLILIFFSLICFALFTPALRAQQAVSQGLHWSLDKGANVVEVSPGEIHITQRAPQDTTEYASASSRLKLSGAPGWKVTFVVRFGQLRSAGSAVGLFDGPTRLCWVGADGWYKTMGSFIGSKEFFRERGPGQFPAADTDWHEFEFSGDGKTIAVRQDGKLIGAQSMRGTPDAIRVGQYHKVFGQNPPAGQQTEIWVRSIKAQRTAAFAKAPVVPTIALPVSEAAPASLPIVALDAPDADSAKRLAFGAAVGLDARAKAPAYPDDEGRLVVTAAESSVMLPARGALVFAPVIDKPDFVAKQLVLYVDGKQAGAKDVLADRPLPTFLVNMARGMSLMRVKIVALNLAQTPLDVLRCHVSTGETMACGAFGLKEERIRLNKAAGATPKSVYVFAENQCLGCITGSMDGFTVDARRLPVGQYRLWAVAQETDGTLTLPVAGIVEILPRFRLSCPAAQGTVAIEKETTGTLLNAVCENGVGIAKAQIYVAGVLVGQSDKPTFEMQTRLTDVPSGTATIEVVGIGVDGTQYPPESIRLQVQNYALNAQAAGNQRLQDVQATLAHLAESDATIEYWYARALKEPEFRTYTSGTQILSSIGFSRTVSTTYLDSITVPGKAAEYWAECRAAVIDRAKIRFDLAKLYRDLGRRDAARLAFQQVVRETGAGSGLGSAAMTELKELGSG